MKVREVKPFTYPLKPFTFHVSSTSVSMSQALSLCVHASERALFLLLSRTRLREKKLSICNMVAVQIKSVRPRRRCFRGHLHFDMIWESIFHFRISQSCNMHRRNMMDQDYMMDQDSRIEHQVARKEKGPSTSRTTIDSQSIDRTEHRPFGIQQERLQ